MYLTNRLPFIVLKFKSHFQVLFHKSTNYSRLKVFSCVVFPYLRPYQSHKFSFHTEKCMFVSNSFNHKGYKCMNISERVYIVQNIIFNEKEFSFFSDVHFK